MAFCQTEELRRWFLTQESQLFRYRLEKLSKEEKLNFMIRNGMNLNQVRTRVFRFIRV